jgi:hypothetical protein
MTVQAAAFLAFSGNRQAPKKRCLRVFKGTTAGALG